MCFCFVGVIGDEGDRGEPGPPGTVIDNEKPLDSPTDADVYKGLPGERGPRGDNGIPGLKGETGAKGLMVSKPF